MTGRDDKNAGQSALSLEAAQSNEADFQDMMETLSAIQLAKTNGDAMGAIASYRHRVRLAALSHGAAPDADAERYRWFRDECAWSRRNDIVEVAGEDAAMLDHHIDKGRCGL